MDMSYRIGPAEILTWWTVWEEKFKVTTAIKIHPIRTMNACVRFYANPSSCCWVWIKVFKLTDWYCHVTVWLKMLQRTQQYYQWTYPTNIQWRRWQVTEGTAVVLLDVLLTCLCYWCDLSLFNPRLVSFTSKGHEMQGKHKLKDTIQVFSSWFNRVESQRLFGWEDPSSRFKEVLLE